MLKAIATKGERLTRRILELLHEIEGIRSLTSEQAEKIDRAIVDAAQDMRVRVKLKNEAPGEFSLRPDDDPRDQT